MTTTVILSSQSIGTGSNAGGDLTFATAGMKTTKQTTTTAFSISARLTNGAGSYSLSNRPVIRYTSSPFSVAYTAAPLLFRNGGSRYLELVPGCEGNLAVSRTSDIETVNGDYIYIWVDAPTVTVAQTLDITLFELP